MKKLTALIMCLSLVLSGCFLHPHGHGKHCPPGQAKKGRC